VELTKLTVYPSATRRVTLVTVKEPALAARPRAMKKAPLRKDELELVIVISTGLGSPEENDQSITLEVNWTQKSEELGLVMDSAKEEAANPRAAMVLTNIFFQ